MTDRGTDRHTCHLFHQTGALSGVAIGGTTARLVVLDYGLGWWLGCLVGGEAAAALRGKAAGWHLHAFGRGEAN